MSINLTAPSDLTAFAKDHNDEIIAELEKSLKHIVAGLTDFYEDASVSVPAKREALKQIATLFDSESTNIVSALVSNPQGQNAPALGSSNSPQPAPTTPTTGPSAADQRVIAQENFIKELAGKYSLTLRQNTDGSIDLDQFKTTLDGYVKKQVKEAEDKVEAKYADTIPKEDVKTAAIAIANAVGELKTNFTTRKIEGEDNAIAEINKLVSKVS